MTDQPQTGAGKPGLAISPLATPFPEIGTIGGVELATARAGFYKHAREDLLVMRFAPWTTCAGVFTRHGVGSAPVDWCKAALARTGGEDIRAVVVNAGCANAFTGAAGFEASRRSAAAVAVLAEAEPDQVMVASTGVIGVLLDASKIEQQIPAIGARLAPDRWAEAGRAIMTTDTFPKGAAAQAEIGGVKVRIAGIAKGSGMIAPDMATMLAFVATDAALAPKVLQALLKSAVARTFNAVTVDGDRSTNDTCLLFATAAAGAPRIDDPADPRLEPFRLALSSVLMDLAQQLVRDGEGASKFVKVTVAGAVSEASARKIARTICESPLVKTAFAGEDANWGRITMAVGRADEPMDRDRLSIRFGPLWAARDGAVSPDYDEEAMSAYMKNAELEVAVDVGVGSASAVMWTCDLTHGYISINGDYRS
ncbi:MAG TPA: bifunctional glutamate N-acetyltransferase/amino-acid acetyltransferase ArgJ [Caulobacteraceae bacterium]|jgi:glutamate N-acetyltransferase/amino-acid N-acetyltransferase|nr:bifunctional glutamate N-acetyltransferase/amino-acid acetyltransferase ArgJ [Caulobacteraceae bacterium]